MLKPIEKPNIPEEIIKQIVSEIHSGSLHPGDRLPSERQLVELLNVGRSSLREAFKVLEAVGLIKRTTEGTILCRPGEIENPGLWLGAWFAEIHEVFETRKLMEIELASLAAQRATAEDIKKIGEIIVEAYSMDQILAWDVSFHRAIVEAAKNTIFSQVYNLVTGLLFQTYKYYSLLEVNEQISKNILSQHKEILRVIDSHDPAAAREAMKNHLDYAEKQLIGEVEKDLPKLKTKGFVKE